MADPEFGEHDGPPVRPGVIAPCVLPGGALLRRYSETGAYTDCYATRMATAVSQADYVEAFYTSWVFKLERLILAWFVARPSTDVEARALASGGAEAFAAWTVEARTDNQLLMCDFQARTRSWLMSTPIDGDAGTGTQLYFGSAVVPVHDRRLGRPAMGLAFRVLLGFHRIYSRVLLRAAMSRLRRKRPTGT